MFSFIIYLCLTNCVACSLNCNIAVFLCDQIHCAFSRHSLACYYLILFLLHFQMLLFSLGQPFGCKKWKRKFSNCFTPKGFMGHVRYCRVCANSVHWSLLLLRRQVCLLRLSKLFFLGEPNVCTILFRWLQQCCTRLVVGQSITLRRVVPILGVPDALVPIDPLSPQISLQPGYTLDFSNFSWNYFSYICKGFFTFICQGDNCSMGITKCSLWTTTWCIWGWNIRYCC